MDGGNEDTYYLWDNKKNKVTIAPGSQGLGRTTLDMGDLDPALEGTFEVTLKKW